MKFRVEVAIDRFDEDTILMNGWMVCQEYKWYIESLCIESLYQYFVYAVVNKQEKAIYGKKKGIMCLIDEK